MLRLKIPALVATNKENCPKVSFFLHNPSPSLKLSSVTPSSSPLSHDMSGHKHYRNVVCIAEMSFMVCNIYDMKHM